MTKEKKLMHEMNQCLLKWYKKYESHEKIILDVNYLSLL